MEKPPVTQDSLEFVDTFDEQYGKAWSNCKEGVAAFAEAYAKIQLQEVKNTMDKGTRNRKYMKVWEDNILHFCDRFGE